MELKSPHQLSSELESAPNTPHIETLDDEPIWPAKGTRLRAWTALLGCFFLMFNSWGMVNAYGSFLSIYKGSLFPSGEISFFNLIGSTQSAVVLFLSFIVGRLLDAGFTRYLIIVGSLLTVLGLLLLSALIGPDGPTNSTLGLVWLVQGFITGLGMACFFVSSSQVVATYFKKRKGFAIGCVATGASIAGLIYPITLRWLLDTYDFNRAVRYLALICALGNITAIILAKPHPDFTPRWPASWWSKRAWIDTSALRNLSFLLFTGAVCMIFFGFYGVFFNLEEWAADTRVAYKGAKPLPCPASEILDPEQEPSCITPGLKTYWLLAMMNGASSIGRLGSSYLCDRYGALNVHGTVTLIAGALCLLLWPFAKSIPPAIAFVLLFGAFSGSVIGLPPASMAAILGPSREAQARLGHWTGMMYTAAFPFALSGPVLEGWLSRRFAAKYQTVQMFSGGCLLVAAGLMFAAHFVSRPGRHRKNTDLSTSITPQETRIEEDQTKA